VLSWDANLRLIYTLDARDDILNGRAGRALLASVRSPTWPPLHGGVSLLAFAFTQPSTVVDAGIGFAFYALLCAGLLAGCIWLAHEEKLPLWIGALAAMFTIVCLFHTRELTAYSLSAMLETQGMFFLWLTILALYRLTSRATVGPWFLLCSSLGLFLTKFPYGHILILAVIPAALWKERPAVPQLFRFCLSTYRGKAAILPAVLVAIIGFLILVRFLPGTPPNVKLFKYGFYAVVVLLLADFNLRLFRAREALSWVPDLCRHLYLYVCLPILALTLLEPDRFSSTVGTQLHQQDSRRSFLLSMASDFTDSPWPILILFAACGILLTLQLLKNRRVQMTSLGFVILVVVLHIAILEFLTSNKQLRHIYHLMPALLALLFLFAVGFIRNVQTHLNSPAALLLFSATAPLLFGPASLFRGEHHASRYTCWTGPDAGMFQPVRDIVALVPQSESAAEKTLLLNDFHNTDAPMPGRAWATDIDLLLRFHLNFRVRNDSRHQWKDWGEFARVLHVSQECDPASGHPTALARAHDVGKTLRRKAHYSLGQVPLCITDYQISGSAEIQ